MKKLLAIAWLVALGLVFAIGLELDPDDVPVVRPGHVSARHFIPAWMIEGTEMARQRSRCARTAGRGQPGSECSGATAAVRVPSLVEYAPPEGTGMGTACACSAVTGSNGEAITFTRASTGWCAKGNERSGIVAGDFVECATDQPRVMPGGDGSSYLGIGRWETRTNVILRSQEFDSLAWSIDATAGRTPIITANAINGPCGAASASCGMADRVQFAQVDIGTYSLMRQTFSSGTYSAGVYVLGNGSSGVLRVWLTTSGSGCITCSYNPSTWTRCVHENQAATSTLYIGNDSLDCGGTAEDAADVFLWQADAQLGSTIGPPITTAGTAATRAAETIQILSPAFAATGCAAATIVNPSPTGLPQKFMVVSNVNQIAYGAFGDTTNAMWMYDGTNSPTSGNGTMSNASPVRMRWQWASGTSLMSAVASTGATIAPGTFDGAMYGGGALDLGGFTTGSNYQINGVIKFVQLDTNASGCNP